MPLPKPLPSFATAGNARHASGSSIAKRLSAGLSTFELRDRGGRIYASDGGHCPRSASLLAMISAGVSRPASLMAYAKLGNAIEAMVVDALDDGATVVATQVHLPEVGLNLGGYIDAVIVLNGRLWVLEIKSCGALPRAPKLLHGAQASVYSAISGLPATVFYFSRSVATFAGDLQTAQFDLEEQGDAQRAALWQVAMAHVATELGVTPNIPPHIRGAKDCGFCPFQSVCWSGEETPAEWPPFVTADEYGMLSTAATRRVNQLLDPTAVAARRVQMLRQIAAGGTPAVRAALATTVYASDIPELTSAT